MSRKSTGKRLRFEIFNRDGFMCQYCGAQPPDAVLVIDHITPVVAGGDNDPLNLITSCEVFNQGKATKILGSVPKPDADLKWLEMQQEISELRRYQEAKKIKVELTNQILKGFQITWAENFDTDFVPKISLLRQWLTWSEPDEIDEAITIAAGQAYKLPNFNQKVRYAAGVLHNITGTSRTYDEQEGDE